ncbi:MAG: hypothetical protein ACT4NY_18285 [Pseudonocardiales bacterium]
MTRAAVRQELAPFPPVPPLSSVTTYQVWGWPVTVRGDQMLLILGAEVTALVLPAGLAEATTPSRPVRWQRRPITPDLAGCREIDVFGVVHTTVRAAADVGGGR